MLKYDTYKQFLSLTIYSMDEAVSPTKICLDFSSVETVDTDMKKIGFKHIPSRE